VPDAPLTQSEAAALLKCTDRMVRKLEKAKQIRRCGQVGRHPRYDPASLLDYMARLAPKGESQ